MTLTTKAKPRTARQMVRRAEIAADIEKAITDRLSALDDQDEILHAFASIGVTTKRLRTAYFDAESTVSFFGKLSGQVICGSRSDARAKAQTQLDAVQGRGA